ncbi:MAG: metallophosphoesterase [Bacteroidetes bacterium]|nr:metallophosphoesterase [Bacteroidota bacterium]
MIKNTFWLCSVFVVLSLLPAAKGWAQSGVVNIIFTSDAHFGITRAKFRGDSNVSGDKVNQAIVSQMNSLPGLTLPADRGIGANQRITGVDYLIEGGDIANRMEPPVQSAAASWAQFDQHYMHQLNLKGHDGRPARLLIVPGNHDISNAIGYARKMEPSTDPSSMVNIYNLMLRPAKQLTNADYHYKKDKVNYSRNIKGIHFMFITLWPDSAERIWMQKELDTVLPKTPVIIVTHDQPECESKHFTNPMPPYNMTVKNKFENLVEEHYKEGDIAVKDEGATAIEQRGFVKFLKAHPNIKAYFHGNSNWNEFYVYHGPDGDVNLNTFRVDSPMKGKYSSKDETQLSFQLISIDPKTQLMTVRECLWDTKPADLNQQIIFGKSATVSLKVK